MKKTLSIFLSAALIVTCLLSIPFTTQAKVNIEWNSTVVFKTETSATNASDRTIWLGLDTLSTTSPSTLTCRGTTAVANYVVGLGNLLSVPILNYNLSTGTSGYHNVEKAEVKDFEWTFTAQSAGSNTRVDATEAYFFHVDTSTESYRDNYKEIYSYDGTANKSAGLANIKDCFAVVYSRQGSTDGLKAQALTVLQPEYDEEGNCLGLFPIKYTKDESTGVITPDASSYILIGDNFQQAAGKIYTITLKGNQLTVVYDQTASDPAYSFTKTFALSNNSLKGAPAGDFVIFHDKTGTNASGAVATYKNMTISELACATNEAYAQTGLLFDSTGESGWLETKTGQAITFSDNEAYLARNFATTNILAHNGVASNIINEIDNFVWEFDFNIRNTSNNGDLNAAFLFHVNDSTVLNTTSTADLRNVLGVVIQDATTQYQQGTAPSSIRISDASSSSGLYLSKGDQSAAIPEDADSSKIPSGATTYQKVSSGIELDYDMTFDTVYKIRIAYKDGAVSIVFYEVDNKAATYRTAYYEYTDAQIGSATFGDFAIVSNWTRAYVSNMKIYTGDEACQYAIDPSYNAYATVYDSEESFAKLDSSKSENGATVEWDAAKNALKIQAIEKSSSNGLSADQRVRLENFDGDNDNLGDFIVKYDWSENHGWTTDHLYFRYQKDGSRYSLNIYKDSTVLNASRPGHRINLYKFDEENPNGVIVAQTWLSKSITPDKIYTIMLKAIGDTFEVYFAPQGTVYDMPILKYTDANPLDAGRIEYYHLKNGDTTSAYLYNFTIYDLTAKAAAEKIADTDVTAVNCTKKADYADILALHDAQIAKFDTAIAEKAEEIITALDHNHQVDAEASSDSTYFVAGKEVKVCGYCNDTVETTLPVAEDALIKDDCKEEFANGNLTITLAYSEALIKDIQNGAVISFNYSIGNYSSENPIEIDGTIGAVITLEGFNVDRLNAQLTYYLTAKYDGVTTDKLAGDTTRTLTVANNVELDSKTKDLITALNAENANTVVSAQNVDANTVYFTENTITADLKEGTMVLNFIASDALVAKLTENKAYTRTNKITVTIDGVVNEYTFTPEVMRKSTTIKISGMSFEQLNGTVTVKVEFIYNNAGVEDITDTITFEGAKAVAATDSDVADAFAEYIAQ